MYIYIQIMHKYTYIPIYIYSTHENWMVSGCTFRFRNVSRFMAVGWYHECLSYLPHNFSLLGAQCTKAKNDLGISALFCGESKLFKPNVQL